MLASSTSNCLITPSADIRSILNLFNSSLEISPFESADFSKEAYFSSSDKFNFPKSNPFEIGFENAWKEILDETNKIFLPQECSVCNLKSICHVCPSVAYAETGEFDKKPTYICDMTKSIYEEMLKSVE